jgi:multiple sugar transport system permease protein
LGTIIFIIIPICASFYISLLDWDLLNLPKFVGFDNYVEIFNEKLFWQILWNTLFYAITTTIFAIIIPLVLAVILNEKIRGANAFKTIFFLPYITPMIVLAVVWAWIFDPNYGVFNFLLHTNIKWLYDSNTAMFALIFVSVWKNIGYNIILMLAGLQNIPEEVDEAAKIDGATGLQKFLKITCPLLSPTILFVSLITTISSFQVFDLIYLMTQGGPENSTSVLVYHMYKNAFEFFKVGKASAIAYVLFGVILLLSMIQWITRKKWVYNEE